MAKLEAGMTREQAFALLQEHNKDPFHIEHGETVEQTMRYFAREFDPENEEFWGIVGLLHDLDWEEHDDEPEQHPVYAAKDIEAAGGPPGPLQSSPPDPDPFEPAHAWSRKRLDAAPHTQQGDGWRKPCPEAVRGGGLCIRLPACAHR